MVLEKLALLLVTPSFALGLAPAPALQPSEPMGFFPSSVDELLKAEAVIDSVPTPARFDTHFRYLTEEPHPAGSERNMELADYVRDRFIEYGLEDVHFHDTPALLSYGRSASVTILEPTRWTSTIRRPISSTSLARR